MYWYKSKSTKSAAKSAYDDFTKDAVTFKSGAAASRAAVDSSPLPSGDETRSYTERKEISTTHTAIYHANVEARRGNLKVSLLYGRERTNAVETEKLARQLVQELLDDAT